MNIKLDLDKLRQVSWPCLSHMLNCVQMMTRKVYLDISLWMIYIALALLHLHVDGDILLHTFSSANLA